MPVWINGETRKRLISASRDNTLRIHESSFTHSFVEVKCELFYAILYALISLEWLLTDLNLEKTKEINNKRLLPRCVTVINLK